MAKRFGRRRRPNVQWMPVFGIGGDENSETANGIRAEIPLDGDPSNLRVDAAGVTFDFTDSAEFAQAQGDQSRTLHDLVAGNAWRLRRIVGKYWCSWFNNPGDTLTTRPPVVDLAAGFIVVRTDDDGNPFTDFEEVNPLTQDSAEDPWIWRRRWLLRTILEDESGGVQALTWARGFPFSTAGYNSVADGPHIDQKTARRIDRSERLFFVQAARVVDPLETTGSYTHPGVLVSYLDYRLLGSIIPASRGNRGNASR